MIVRWIFKHKAWISAILFVSLIPDMMIMNAHDRGLIDIMFWIVVGKVFVIAGLSR